MMEDFISDSIRRLRRGQVPPRDRADERSAVVRLRALLVEIGMRLFEAEEGMTDGDAHYVRRQMEVARMRLEMVLATAARSLDRQVGMRERAGMKARGG